MPESDARSVVWGEFHSVRRASCSIFPRISKVAEQFGDDPVTLFIECFPLPVSEPRPLNLNYEEGQSHVPPI